MAAAAGLVRPPSGLLLRDLEGEGRGLEDGEGVLEEGLDVVDLEDPVEGDGVDAAVRGDEGAGDGGARARAAAEEDAVARAGRERGYTPSVVCLPAPRITPRRRFGQGYPGLSEVGNIARSDPQWPTTES